MRHYGPPFGTLLQRGLKSAALAPDCSGTGQPVVGWLFPVGCDYGSSASCSGTEVSRSVRKSKPWLCSQIVKLSDAVQPLPRQTTEFVHGVSKSFLAVGAQKALPVENGGERFKPKIYFMGKVSQSPAIWAATVQPGHMEHTVSHSLDQGTTQSWWRSMLSQEIAPMFLGLWRKDFRAMRRFSRKNLYSNQL